MSNPKQSIADIMLDHGGNTLMVAEEKWNELNDAIRENGGSGSVTIKLSVKHIGVNEIEIAPSVVATIPKKKIATKRRYLTIDNAVVVDDPNLHKHGKQLEMVPKKQAQGE